MGTDKLWAIYNRKWVFAIYELDDDIEQLILEAP